MRSHRCAEVGEAELGKEVTLCGWVHSRRDHGGVTFIDLRDTSGLIQVTFDVGSQPDAHETAQALRSEWCISVTGTVQARPEGTINPRLATGRIEVAASALEVLSAAETP